MKKSFYQEVRQIALPITLQCIFQSSLSFIDQLMVGQLGSTCLAGTGVGVMLLFMLPSYFCPSIITRIYSEDQGTIQAASEYLQIIAAGFPAVLLTSMFSALLRSMKQTKLPFIASAISILVNLLNNYLLIFGHLGFPAMGIRGAAIATTLARYVEAAILLIAVLQWNQKEKILVTLHYTYDKKFLVMLGSVIAPILLNEFLWSLGENLYAVIYGRMSTDDMAAMTMTNCIQGLFVGAFSGISAAAGIMTGSRLGRNDNEEAYEIGRKLVRFGFFGSIILGGLIILLARFYVLLYPVNQSVRQTTVYILYAFGILLFSKVCNMILGGGILRSGGKTMITLVIDLIGTWCIGLPLGFLTAFVLKLPIYQVYFILSLEECVRLLIGIYVFRTRKWMKNVVTQKEITSECLLK